ncbi:hypothetical protein ABIE27_006012 [Paenibacillus sp. 4624]|uniref:hypothetical protein n=1 Tax=Paenibacillus sp. 4624 TaxID=3156453 RepID=UPI003D2482D0
MSIASMMLIELLENHPRVPDSEYEGKYTSLNFNWKANGDNPDDVVEHIFSELKGQVPLDEYMDLTAQCIYRWLGKQESEADMKETLFNFLNVTFATPIN